MEATDLNEVIECLPTGKTQYRYYKSAYAPKLLSLLIKDSAPIAKVRRSAYSRLLETPVLRDVLAASGDGQLRQEQLQMAWREPSLPFVLTVDRWAYDSRDWSQVSRPGDNLVLQLNLSQQHCQLFEQCVGDFWEFNGYCSHPVKRINDGQPRETLAWARIDVDFSTNEALIEEIQSDAAREMAALKKHIQKCRCQQCQTKRQYLQWFEPYRALWSEVMLMAAIEFIRQELGIRWVFMHTARSGWRVKQMSEHWQPPVSLYSDLPQRFAFRQVWNAPAFLLRERSYQKLVRKQPDLDFFEWDFGQSIYH